MDFMPGRDSRSMVMAVSMAASSSGKAVSAGS